MKNLNDLLLLGNPLLYEKAAPILREELPLVSAWVADLHNVMEEIRAKYHFGRGIAAPQLGIMKRLIYTNVEKPMIFINPELTYKSEETFDIWDDCMSFPHLLVKVNRHKTIVVNYLDENWQAQHITFHDALSELFQHEYDHLNGVLCTMRAVHDKAFSWRP